MIAIPEAPRSGAVSPDGGEAAGVPRVSGSRLSTARTFIAARPARREAAPIHADARQATRPPATPPRLAPAPMAPIARFARYGSKLSLTSDQKPERSTAP